MSKFKEYKELNLPSIHRDILSLWKKNNVFKNSIQNRKNGESFTFYEGPPSANGMPGIHHVISRTIKDLFCRYKTLKGFQVNRKAGWDTHGLPVELGVEKELNLTKEDIGTKISIEKYNKACRVNVMKYKQSWENITDEMGYWVDMDNPYVTYDNKYIESVWWLLKKLHEKKLLYKGHTIQPFSPKAGTGLSTHELNQPGCYKNIKDTSAVAKFKIIKNDLSDFLFSKITGDVFFIAWTTTPWTLPSNTALAVGEKISYVLVETVNQYTGDVGAIVLAKELVASFFKKENENTDLNNYTVGEKNLPYVILDEFKGERLKNIKYEQLLKYALPEKGEAFKVLIADFVTTEGGTGIVHLAPSFGADDNRVAKQNGIGSLTLVDEQGRFTKEVLDFYGQYVKDEYYMPNDNKPKLPVDVQIIIKLKEEGKLFKSEKYEHSYPHCWRTDKPILYYPLDSWFVKTTSHKERMLELNNTINWKPTSTGEGRFGNWLKNLVDWNLSRSRFWGIPLPIWRTEDGNEEICIGSIEELKIEIDRSVSAGYMKDNPLGAFISGDFSEKNYSVFDLHRPYVDDIKLVSSSGVIMTRELDLIDVWFDSGSMPYAQLHYPFENKDLFQENFPADFIAEGVDQTRGWFFTLHVISTLIFDSVAYKNVVSNGLALDKNGNKMSKRLGNTIDPFITINKYGADATRWYMISNTQPWDNLKFDEGGILEVQRKFFGTLYNAYSFFALYANIDNYKYNPKLSTIAKRDKTDKWIISELNSLIKEVEENYENYEPTKAARLIQDFVINKLSNWYIRLNRRRFWKGEFNLDKKNAYSTLFECLEVIALISCPIAPFFMDKLYQDLHDENKSIHLSTFPIYNSKNIDEELESQMQIAQRISSSILSLRKKEGIRVRQPLNTVLITSSNSKIKQNILAATEIILKETNLKNLEIINEGSSIVSKKAKPNYKKLGPKYGKKINAICEEINNLNSAQIKTLEENNKIKLSSGLIVLLDDVDVISESIAGYSVSSNDLYSVALDINISKTLKDEGLSRELVNRIQNLRKNKNFLVTDKICVNIEKNDDLESAIKNNLTYICNETLTDNLIFTKLSNDDYEKISLIDNIFCNILILKK
jgi:isoleucyl-tRNA synthetase|tara:strand:- start:15983 stop:19315 length:3333 start_codon:yes stop_codon:yes gene_type:complete